MNRLNYAIGSEEDIPEVEEMSPEEFEDIKKMIGAPTEQASGIRSLPKDKTAGMGGVMKLFETPYGFDRNGFESALLEFQDYKDSGGELGLHDFVVNEWFGMVKKENRKAPSIKLAEYQPGDYDPLIVEEYEKYKYDAEEQGQPVMSIDEFLRMVRAGAMSGGIMRANYALGSKLYDSPFDARRAADLEDRATYRDIQKTTYPIKKEGDKIDLDVEKIKQLIEKSKKEKIKKAKGGIAGVL